MMGESVGLGVTGLSEGATVEILLGTGTVGAPVMVGVPGVTAALDSATSPSREALAEQSV